MSDGGLLAWKRQNINAVPMANYSDLKRPIELPEGSSWHRDPDTNEWSVVQVQNQESEAITTATPVPLMLDANVVSTVSETEDDLMLQKDDFLVNKEDENHDDDSNVISHVVQKSDTLQGICLKVCDTQYKFMMIHSPIRFQLKLITAFVTSYNIVQDHSYPIETIE